MGVKELWTVLSPVKEQCSLSSLSGQTLAVDLSGWICQANTTRGLSTAVSKPYLRQLFVRVSRLYCEGVSLVMVLDGEAIRLKWATMDTRAKAMGGACNYSNHRSTGRRPHLNRQIKECCELLDALGVPYLQSAGEAEALCALLNMKGYVDGVLTQDGDAFLYGATVVYKDLSTDIKNPTVDCYTSARIESQLGLTRTDLVSLALLVGCDYCPQGVPGVGRTNALKFIDSCKPRDSVEVMRGWGDMEEGSECKVQRLSKGVIGFPSEAVIKEFMNYKDRLPTKQLHWSMPLVQDLQLLCLRGMEWLTDYTCKKAQYLLTQWLIREKRCGQDPTDRAGLKCTIGPTRIVKDKRERKIQCYEVSWSADSSLAGEVDECSESSTVEFTTIENAQRFENAYPELCRDFEHKKQTKKAKKPKSKGSKVSKTKTDTPDCSSSQSCDDPYQSDLAVCKDSPYNEPINPSPNVPNNELLFSHSSPCILTPDSLPSPTPTLSTQPVLVDSDSEDECTLYDRLKERTTSQDMPNRCHTEPQERTTSQDMPNRCHTEPQERTTSQDMPNRCHTEPQERTTSQDMPNRCHTEPQERTTSQDMPNRCHTEPQERTASQDMPNRCHTEPQERTTSQDMPNRCHTEPQERTASQDMPNRCHTDEINKDSITSEVEKLLAIRTPSPVLVCSSDEEDPLPLLARLRKSPTKVSSDQRHLPITTHSHDVKQLRLDSFFPQKRSARQTKVVMTVPNIGSQTEPIVID